MIIETKYSIGDQVWFASTTTVSKQLPCPDCNGTKKWKAISPAGGEYEFNCPRCSSKYGPNHPLTLRYTQFTGTTHRLTIGQVRAQAGGRTDEEDRGNEYMCHETGVGSGSVYRENRLFPTQEEAQVAADVMAAEQNAGGVPWVKKQYDEVVELCDYELSEARSVEARKAKTTYEWKIHDLFNDIEAADTKAQVDKLVEEFRK